MDGGIIHSGAGGATAHELGGGVAGIESGGAAKCASVDAAICKSGSQATGQAGRAEWGGGAAAHLDPQAAPGCAAAYGAASGAAAHKSGGSEAAHEPGGGAAAHGNVASGAGGGGLPQPCRVDLHTHSSCSDGSMAPTDLVQLAASCGIRTLALTDHDTIDGIAPALAAAALIPPQDGFALIPGVEISASYRAGASGLLKEIHILGYFRPDGYESIAPFIGMMKRERNARNYKIIAKLNALGMRITVGDAEEEAKKAVFGRPHIAAALVRKGYADDINGAFERYLALGKKAYAPKEYPTPAQCAAAISEAGGVAAIAHPVRSGMRLRELRAMIESLLPHGLAGIEAYYTDNTPQDTANCIAVAKAFGLVMTGGSDFHGEYKKNIRLGVGKGNLRVPDALPDMLLERLRAGGARRPTR